MRPKFDMTFDNTAVPLENNFTSPRNSHRTQIIKSVLDNKQKYAVSGIINDPRNSTRGVKPPKYNMDVAQMAKQGMRNAYDEFGLEGFPEGKYPTFDAK